MQLQRNKCIRRGNCLIYVISYQKGRADINGERGPNQKRYHGKESNLNLLITYSIHIYSFYLILYILYLIQLLFFHIFHYIILSHRHLQYFLSIPFIYIYDQEETSYIPYIHILIKYILEMTSQITNI